MSIFKVIILFCCLFQAVSTDAMAYKRPIVSEENDSTTFKITFLKSTGEPQKDVFLRKTGDFKRYDADTNGIVTFNHCTSGYLYRANVYFKDVPQEVVKEIPLSLGKTEMTVYVDSPDDMKTYRKNNQLFPIEGMVQNNLGEPIERATVSIQGTGRRTLTDEIGLFTIEADYNHPIVIRANGMNNRSLPLSFFIDQENEPVVIMEPKNDYRVYNSVENMPSYPGGMKALKQYLDKNLTYPEKAKKAKIEGVVVVQFIVEKNGAITEPKIARHLETTLDTIAWNTVRNMPNWIPGSDYGNVVRCKYSIPVAFKIPKPKPIVPVDSLKLRRDSLALDSLRADSIRLDSLRADSLAGRGLLADSLKKDSIKLSTSPADSLQNDSTRHIVDTEKATVKAKKRNIFARFFRWLFGIDRRERRRAERAEKAQLLLKANQDSVHIETDSIDIDLKTLKQKADSLVKNANSIQPTMVMRKDSTTVEANDSTATESNAPKANLSTEKLDSLPATKKAEDKLLAVPTKVATDTLLAKPAAKKKD